MIRIQVCNGGDRTSNLLPWAIYYATTMPRDGIVVGSGIVEPLLPGGCRWLVHLPIMDGTYVFWIGDFGQGIWSEEIGIYCNTSPLPTPPPGGGGGDIVVGTTGLTSTPEPSPVATVEPDSTEPEQNEPPVIILPQTGRSLSFYVWACATLLTFAVQITLAVVGLRHYLKGQFNRSIIMVLLAIFAGLTFLALIFIGTTV